MQVTNNIAPAIICVGGIDMRWIIIAVAIAFALSGCSAVVDDSIPGGGPVCTGSRRMDMGGTVVDYIYVTYYDACCDDYAARAILDLCVDNALDGIRFSGLPDVLYVDVNDGETIFEAAMDDDRYVMR